MNWKHEDFKTLKERVMERRDAMYRRYDKVQRDYHVTYRTAERDELKSAIDALNSVLLMIDEVGAE